MSTISTRSTYATAVADVIDDLAGLSADGALAQLRQRRKEVRLATQGSFDALFGPGVKDGPSGLERELVAWRIALLQHDDNLAAFHRERAQSRGADTALLLATKVQPVLDAGQGRWSALLRFVDRLTLQPAAARASHLTELREHGLSAADVVTLAQLVAFVNYEIRLLAGLRALGVTAAASQSDPPVADTTVLLRGTRPSAAEPPSSRGFTIEPLEWAAWLPTVDVRQADAQQLLVLDESNASARTSPYYLTLVHNPAVLRQRSKLFNAIMYAPGGLPRAERELTTLGVSLVNGCPYCASVHARLFAQLTKEPQVIAALFESGVNAALTARRRALVDLAVNLSDNPPTVPTVQVQTLRALGLDDLQLLDAIHAAAIFAWANRLMQTLGEPVAPAIS